MAIEQLAGLLQRLELRPTEEDVLDVLWLAAQTGALAPAAVVRTDVPGSGPGGGAMDERPAAGPSEPPAPPPAANDDLARAAAPTGAGPAADAEHFLHLEPVMQPDAAFARPAVALRAPAPSALDSQLELGRALRPLKRRQDSGRLLVLDEEATANQIAERDIWVPAYRPAASRWLELALVVDGYESMAIWSETIGELRKLLERLGIFSDVRFWTLDQADADPARLGVRRLRDDSAMRSARELMDSAGRRVILVVSDCLGPAWRSGAAQRLLAEWGRRGPVAILQPLPQRLWRYTHAYPVAAVLRALRPGAPNAQLTCSHAAFAGFAGQRPVPVPLLELGPAWLASWSRLITAAGTSGVDAMVVFADEDLGEEEFEDPAGDGSAADPQELVQRFREGSSPEAFTLAVYLAAAPISLPVMRLVQRAMMGTSNQAQIAEVFLGGLLRRQDGAGQASPEHVQYDFISGVRDLLLRRLRRNEALRVLDEVSTFIDVHFGQARDFQALLSGTGVSGGYLIDHHSRPFAVVAEQVLRRIGGQYAGPADKLRDALYPLPAGDSMVTAGRAPDGLEAPAGPGRPSGPGTAEEPPAGHGAGLAPAGNGRSAGDTASFAAALAQIPLPIRRSQWSPLVCPYCYEAFSEGEILFRCSGRASLSGKPCPRVTDRKLLQKMGQGTALPPVFAADVRRDEAICPDCKLPTRLQVCPGCHSRLPANFRTVQGRLIALVGPSQAGKTAFMTVLIHELRHQAGALLNSSTNGADDTTQERYQSKYEWPLYTQSRPFERTTVVQEYLSPLVFRFTMNQQTRFRSYQRELLLSFIDSAGEDLVSEFKIELMVNYLAAADAIIVMLDPLQFPGARRRLNRGGPLPVAAPAEEQPGVALDRVTQMLHVGTGGGKIDKPVAVVLTKLDMLWPMLPADSVLRAPPVSTTYFDSQESLEIQAGVTGMLSDWEAPEIDAIVRKNYACGRFFAVSSLGAAPAAGNSAPNQGIHPYRVLDPFMWLLSRFNFVRSR